ncbi:hypothetical protein IFM89_014961 [Coptis chinensis]|uniref:Dolichyl-diphosphooligosaccharide-protein glycosyltransferase subunit OST5 n=1 Tax=Coptis chinensis TaxID=261450 RepID=A0A835HJV5_9MAGN|nr:hypothetical protein IFM89_014961 [Coptis chinensis]
MGRFAIESMIGLRSSMIKSSSKFHSDNDNNVIVRVIHPFFVILSELQLVTFIGFRIDTLVKIETVDLFLNHNTRQLFKEEEDDHNKLGEMTFEAKPITSPIAVAYYPSLAVVMIGIGLIVTASFFIYEATSSKKNRSFTKELIAGTVASVFLGFGSLFLLLASGVYV